MICVLPNSTEAAISVRLFGVATYGCTKYRDKKSETGIKWDDPDLNIKWPVKKPILSNKDKNNISLKEFLK